MHISDIIRLTEAVEIRELIEQVSHAILATMHAFVENRAKTWQRDVTAERRLKFGYDRHFNTADDWMEHRI